MDVEPTRAEVQSCLLDTNVRLNAEKDDRLGALKMTEHLEP